MKNKESSDLKLPTVDEAYNAIISHGLIDYDDLTNKVNYLKIEIAKAKDANKPYNELQKLLDEYWKLGVDYDEAWARKRKKDKKITKIFLISFFSVMLLLGLLSLIMLLIFD